MQQARRTGATVMMHAENGIAIDQLVAQAIAAGQTDPVQHGLTRPPELEGEATSRAITAGQGHRRAAVHRAPVRAAGAGGGRGGPGHRPERVRRDLPAVPLPVHRRPGQAGLRGRQVRGLSPAAAEVAPGDAVAGAAHQRPVRGVHRPLPVLLQGPEGARPRRLLQDPERDARRRAPDGPAAPGRGRPARSRCRAGSRSRSTTPARMFGLYPRKGVIAARRGRGHRDLRPDGQADAVGGDAPHERGLLGVRGHGDHRPGARPCCRAGSVVIDAGEYRGRPGHGRFLARDAVQYLN